MDWLLVGGSHHKRLHLVHPIPHLRHQWDRETHGIPEGAETKEIPKHVAHAAIESSSSEGRPPAENTRAKSKKTKAIKKEPKQVETPR